MRKFYEIYLNWSAVTTELSWSYFQKLIRVDRKEEKELIELAQKNEKNQIYNE